MSAEFARNDASIQDKKSVRQRIVRVVIVTMIVTLAGIGLFRDQLTFADTPSDVPQSSANAALLSAQTTADTAMSVADVAEAANPGVVTVYNLQTINNANQFGVQIPNQGNDSGEPQAVGAGSGWIYDSDGHVVTNAHVVAGAEEIEVEFYDGTTVTARVIGTDTVQDVAVLKLELDEGQELPGVSTIGDSGALRPGDQVVAIGSPLGEFTNSVSEGIIGGLDRSLDTETGGTLDNLIQHDAPISSGNSGGPLLNMQGEVIGMNVAKIDTAGSEQVSASGLNFAIDGNTVSNLADEIIASGESIAYPYLGVASQETLEGAGVVDVEPGGPADEAGIEAGDLITELNGEAIGPDSSLSQLLYQHRPGDEVELTIVRDGSTETVTVTLGTRPDSIM